MADTKPASESLLGRRPDGYVVLEELSADPRTTVYRAMDPSARDRLVAFEVMNAADRRPVLGEDENPFRRGREVSRRVHHPGLVRIHRTGQLADGRYYRAMELPRGMTLADELRHRRTMPWREALQVALQVAEAVAAMHGAGWVHRDVHPGRVRLRTGRDGQLRVQLHGLDAARLPGEDDHAASGVVPGSVGTPPYISPEHATGWGSKPTSDVWAIGALLYEMVAGIPALGVGCEGRADCLARLRSEAAIPAEPLAARVPDLPEPLVALVERTLDRVPRARPRNGRLLARDLRHAAARSDEIEGSGGSLVHRLKASLEGLLGRGGR